MTGPRGKASPPWHRDEDAKLMRICEHPIIGDAGWRKVAEQFPGRTRAALRQRYLALRNMGRDAAKQFRYASSRDPKAPRGYTMQEPIDLASLPQHATLTAYVFGDPLPGRSALDQRMAQR